MQLRVLAIVLAGRESNFSTGVAQWSCSWRIVDDGPELAGDGHSAYYTRAAALFRDLTMAWADGEAGIISRRGGG